MNPNYITMVHIADIHFGCVNPEEEMKILQEQFLDPISRISFDILAIDGDLFDRRFSANNPAITYAIEFINKCAMLCVMRNATLFLIGGTESHDAGQLSLFYTLHDATGCDVRIIEHAQFQYVKGLKILCLPEEYGKGIDYYENFLKQIYDMVFMHGTLVGGIPGATQEDLNARREPVFSIDSFSGCKGPIISGHVHTAMCLQQHMYYLSSPIRWRFGEEAEKGYAIVLLDRNTYRYDYNFMPINSFIYKTIGINDLSSTDPNAIIDYLNKLKASGVDYIRLNCTGLYPYQVSILAKYVREHANSGIKLQNAVTQSANGELISAEVNTEEANKLDGPLAQILLNDSLDEYTKFVMYLNLNEGDEYMTVDRLKKLLSDS